MLNCDRIFFNYPFILISTFQRWQVTRLNSRFHFQEIGATVNLPRRITVLNEAVHKAVLRRKTFLCREVNVEIAKITHSADYEDHHDRSMTGVLPVTKAKTTSVGRKETKEYTFDPYYSANVILLHDPQLQSSFFILVQDFKISYM